MVSKTGIFMSHLTSLSGDKSRIQGSNFLDTTVLILNFTLTNITDKMVFEIIISKLVGGLVDHNK